MLNEQLDNVRSIVKSSSFWESCERELMVSGIREENERKVDSLLDEMQEDLLWKEDALKSLKRAKILEYYMLAVKSLIMCESIPWVSELLSKRKRMWVIKFGKSNIAKNMEAQDSAAAINRKLEKLKHNSENNPKATVAYGLAIDARHKSETAADIIALASLLGYSDMDYDVFGRYLSECHELVVANGLEEGMYKFFEKHNITKYIELSLKTLSAIYWSRFNFRYYAYAYIEFVHNISSDKAFHRIVGLLLRDLINDSSLEEAPIDGKFSNLAALETFNKSVR